MRFAILLAHLCKVLLLPRKINARSYEVLHLSRKIISANLKISEAPNWTPPEEISALTSWHLWWTCLLYCAGHAKCIFADPLQMSLRLPMFLKQLQNPHVLLTFDKVHNPVRLPRKTTSECPKVLHTPQFFALLTSKCASRHNGVHFFDISTSKSGPELMCFVMCFAPQRRALFDISTSKSGPELMCFVMCFAPQRRALFRHLNFQKWSGADVFRNVLRATTACTFSTSQLPKVVRERCVLYILTSKCASRHNGVQLFISHLASWLRTRRFSEPTFRPSGATNHWKNTVFRDFPTFSRICIFFLLTLSLLWSSLF